MKLLLLLLAIYSLIFYQSYKIEKSKTSSSEPEKVAKSDEYYPDAGLRNNDNNDKKEGYLFTRNQFTHTDINQDINLYR